MGRGWDVDLQIVMIPQASCATNSATPLITGIRRSETRPSFPTQSSDFKNAASAAAQVAALAA